MEVKIKKLRDGAVVPAVQTAGAAGVDLHAVSGGTLNPGDAQIIGTGLVMEIPAGHVGLICSRSGLAAKHSVFVLNAPGVIDSDYRGEVGVILFNAGRQKWRWAAGDRIAQMLITGINLPAFVLADSELSDTERGSGGFGSTGES